MEVALGCIFVVFGGRGVSRLRLLLNLHGLQCDFQAAQEAARLLRPHSRISLKLVSKYLQLGEEEQRETDLLFSVKKLLSFGQGMITRVTRYLKILVYPISLENMHLKQF